MMNVLSTTAATLLLICHAFAQNSDGTCSASVPCSIGCCGGSGTPKYCGLGPTYCATGNCISSCNYKSECDPGWGMQWSNASTCPLNVCCSKFGFCGTTSDFCGGVTVPSPSCSVSGNSVSNRTIGYFEGWNLERPCDTMQPENVPLGYYSHINFAFASINPLLYTIEDMAPDVGALYQRVSALKLNQPDLQVWLSIGGWSFNDPGPTANTFSNLAGSTGAQEIFFASLISFLKTNNFDGVDLDWEYPVAPERGGKPADFQNYPSLLKNLRKAMDASGTRYGLSITLPSSYWYLRNFDIVTMDPVVDWFNIMTYDLHGTWDGTDPFIGAVALAHTNLTEINTSLELLWRNHIDPQKVTLGLGFYGRSFTMSSSSCLSAGCPFTGGGKAGPCTQTVGILSADEIRAVIAACGTTTTTDPVAAVQIVTWGGNQWVSYDDATTFKTKIDYANSHCLGGLMVWAADLDTDGLSIDALGSGLGRAKKETVAGGPSNDTDILWTGADGFA